MKIEIQEKWGGEFSLQDGFDQEDPGREGQGL